MARKWCEERTTFADVKERVRAFLRARDWEQEHSPKNLSMSIAIESAELMEIFQWVSSEKAAEFAQANPDRLQHVREEVADVVIYCISMANALDIDLAEAIDQKIVRNAERYPPLTRGPKGREKTLE